MIEEIYEDVTLPDFFRRQVPSQFLTFPRNLIISLHYSDKGLDKCPEWASKRGKNGNKNEEKKSARR